MKSTDSKPSTARSEALYERAIRVIPGGVSSPVRAFRAVGGTPRFIARAASQHITDADGNTYLDFVNSWGALILGHAHPAVVGAITEAVMSAIRLARAFTGRDLIVKFSGCYHGHADHLLVAAGSGLATFGKPSSAGVPEAFTACTRVLPLDDETALEELFAKEGSRIAAVIIEPVPANHGLLLQRPEFLQAIRRVTQQHGTLLIFDEVISGFRLARGGVAELSGITPDLATFGKVIGGGMPVGAFGGPRKIMARLAPDGDTYQAGTLSGNPVAMASGIATLDIMMKENGWQKLEALGAELERMLRPVLTDAGFPVHLTRKGSLFWMSFHEDGVPRTAAPLTAAASERFGTLFHAMLDRGVYLPPSAYEACFLSLAHTSADLQRFTQALRESFAAIGKS